MGRARWVIDELSRWIQEGVTEKMKQHDHSIEDYPMCDLKTMIENNRIVLENILQSIATLQELALQHQELIEELQEQVDSIDLNVVNFMSQTNDRLAQIEQLSLMVRINALEQRIWRLERWLKNIRLVIVNSSSGTQLSLLEEKNLASVKTAMPPFMKNYALV